MAYGKMFFIRHAPTKANLAGDIVKDYDSYDIMDFDVEKWKNEIGIHIPKDFKLFVSPAKRCQQTAEKLFPGKEYKVIDDLSEFDISALGDLKFWEISEEQFNSIVGLTKYQAFCKIRSMAYQVSRDVCYCAGENAVLIGHGFYGRLMKDIYEGNTLSSEPTVLELLNSKPFSFRNLDMMELEKAEVNKIYHFEKE